MRGAVVITLTIATYALFLVMLQGEGVDAETELNGTSTNQVLCSILVDRPTTLDACIEKCEKIACQYKSLTKEDVLECIRKCREIF